MTTQTRPGRRSCRPGQAGGLAAALRERGVDEPAASLTAEAGIAVFRVAFERWVAEGNERALPDLISESLDALKALN